MTEKLKEVWGNLKVYELQAMDYPII